MSDPNLNEVLDRVLLNILAHMRRQWTTNSISCRASLVAVSLSWIREHDDGISLTAF